MKFDISIEQDLSDLVTKSIYKNEYVIEEHMSLEDAADEICGILSEEQEIAQEDFMETFRKVKAFIVAIFRKIVNLIKMWWKKRAIKRLCKTLKNKLAPLTLVGQLCWFISVIFRNQMKMRVINGITESVDGDVLDGIGMERLDYFDDSGRPQTFNENPTPSPTPPPQPSSSMDSSTDENDSSTTSSTGIIRSITNDALILILFVCSSGDFALKIATLKRMIKEISVSDMDRTVSDFRKSLDPEAIRFVRNGGIFGKGNFTSGSGVNALCDAAAKQLRLRDGMDNIASWGISGAEKLGNAIDLSDSTKWGKLPEIIQTVIMKNYSTFGGMGASGKSTNSSIANLYSAYSKLPKDKQRQFDDAVSSVIGDTKLLTKGDCATIERSLTDLVDFYNLFSLKLLHFMDRMEPDERESIEPLSKVAKEMLHQIFGIIHHCNYIVADINMNKYDIDLSSVEEILDDSDEIGSESLDYDDSFLTEDDLLEY